jgi:hypothetical protein
LYSGFPKFSTQSPCVVEFDSDSTLSWVVTSDFHLIFPLLLSFSFPPSFRRNSRKDLKKKRPGGVSKTKTKILHQRICMGTCNSCQPIVLRCIRTTWKE